MVVGMVFVSPIWVKVSILAQDAEYCKLCNMNPSEYTHMILLLLMGEIPSEPGMQEKTLNGFHYLPELPTT